MPQVCLGLGLRQILGRGIALAGGRKLRRDGLHCRAQGIERGHAACDLPVAGFDDQQQCLLAFLGVQVGEGLQRGLGLCCQRIRSGTLLILQALLLDLLASVGGGLLAFVFARRDFLGADNLLGGIAVGLVVVGGWYVSGHLGYLAEDPETLQEAFVATNSGRMESLTFVAPQAYTLELLMLWSDSSRKLSFTIASALGVIAGSLAYALATRSFRWEGFRDVEDTARHLAGAALMGFGGVVGMGCTIGQGISGVSTLAAGSILTLLSIVAGAAAMLKYQYWRVMREA